MVIIGRYQESVDIMEKEGSLLADRPRAVAAGEILSRGLHLILAPAGEQFHRLRRAAHTHLQAKAAESYVPIQMNAARNVILDILNNPKGHQAAANRYTASVILRIIVIQKMLKRFQMLMRPGALLVERYPILKYVPGYGTELEQWRREESQLFHDQLDRVLRELVAKLSLVARYLLENQSSHKLSTKKWLILLASACYPKAQEKVQEELDVVISRDRGNEISTLLQLPPFDDYNSSPQIEAFMLECLRWRPMTTLGFTHQYVYPEGAIVFGNHWAISRDPSVYPNPDQFDPQRWLNTDGKIRDDLKFPSFGFGRRICPGQHIANRSIFINAALLLWSFKITQDPENPIDESGFVDGVIVHPKPFAACFEPRFGNEAALRGVMGKYGEGL
ncbi:cytochrome P450 [Suillus paluster]|uniref:cytochrome P450 n=1 Tax=Suillus paluster TaxID=48578 RepID=UPI001B86A26D|nr:cytochrome P450 [Suillus paluster]KAG1728293.1 cytochrome P450 [Suillus paluster]